MRTRSFVTASLAVLAVFAAPAAMAQPAQAPPAQNPSVHGPAATGPVASGVRINPQGQTQTAAASPPGAWPFIEPRTDLERALLAATNEGSTVAQRESFKRLFLNSEVALALSSTSPDAPPGQITLRSGRRTTLIFTSSARATEIMGESQPRVMMSGREALERVRGANVIINIDRRPFITLDAAGVETFLAASPAAAEPAAPQTPAPPSESAGPSQ